MAKHTQPNTYNMSEDFRDGFQIGAIFQAMTDGIIDITKSLITDEGVDFVRAMAADNDYEFSTVELEDGMTDVILHRIG